MPRKTGGIDLFVRVLLPSKQVGPGYLAGVSPARIYVRA